MNNDDGILVFKRHYDPVVRLPTTSHGIHPIWKAERYLQGEKKSVAVERPIWAVRREWLRMYVTTE